MQFSDKKLKKNSKSSKTKEISSFRLFQTSLIYQTREFFNNSTLHGVRYIAETGRPFIERFMWFCFTTIGFISALIIIVSLWEKFQTNPTITGLDMDVHNQHLVFPTIVVCPLEPFSVNRTYDLAYAHLGGYEDESVAILEPFLKLLTQLSYNNMYSAVEASRNITQSEQYRRAMNKKTLRALMFQISVFCNETLDVCKYRDEEIKCCDFFQPVYSEHGFCYAFNAKYIDTADTEKSNPYFHDLFETDKKWSLIVTPKIDSTIFVHSHYETFGWDFRPHITWEPEFSVELLISMKQTYTADDARQLSIQQRKCIFPNEIKLDFYNEEYSFTNCMKECRLKKSMKLCKCIAPFYRPNAQMPFCNIQQLECLSKYMENITNVKDCHVCELSCSNTVYDIEKLSKTSADSSKPNDNFINVEYLTWPIIRYKREVLFGWVDLLVSFGGIAGLFLGFSLLSGVEIIYYFTLRAFCMLYKNRDELYKIEDEKLSRPPDFIDLSLKYVKNPVKMNSSIDKNVIQVAEVTTNSNSETPRYPKTGQMNRMNRVTLRMQAANIQKIPTKLTTSYDYANTKGLFYIP